MAEMIMILICDGGVDGHYLNLPVIDDEQHIVGLVDVLRLTYATLDQASICLWRKGKRLS